MHCTHCQSENIVSYFRAVDQAENYAHQDLSLRVDLAPDAWVFKDTQMLPMTPHVCVDCGHVMFFVSKSAIKDIEQFKNQDQPPEKQNNRGIQQHL